VRICVLIAAKNEGIAIGSTIESIVSAGVDKKDVYLVSDGSSDDTALLGMARGIRVLDLPVNGGKSLAIAKGIKHFNLASYDLRWPMQIPLSNPATSPPWDAPLKNSRMRRLLAAKSNLGLRTGSRLGVLYSMRLVTG